MPVLSLALAGEESADSACVVLRASEDVAAVLAASRLTHVLFVCAVVRPVQCVSLMYTER